MPFTDSGEARALKIERLRAGAAPRVLELASGCGGLALGLKTAGFDLVAHVESDPTAAETYALNFGSADDARTAWAEPRDMVSCSAAELVRDLGLGAETNEAFDVLAAGLPCQAFARIGRSKLRELAGDGDAFLKDPRAGLYRQFLDYVHDAQPLAIIIENVPDILNFGGHNVPEEICETLEGMGYHAAYTILNAAHYGVPQVRERLFLIALAGDLGVRPTFPDPTHFLDLPRGYEGSRRVALKHVPPDSTRFRPIHDPSPLLSQAVSAEEALGDLPEIREHRSAPKTISRRRLHDRLKYRAVAGVSEYARSMRTWPSFEATDDVDGHLVRLTPRDFPIFQEMPPGADYPRARALAEAMLLETAESRGTGPLRPSRSRVRPAEESHCASLRPCEVPEQVVEAGPAEAVADIDGPHGQGHLLPHPLRQWTGTHDIGPRGRSAAVVP